MQIIMWKQTTITTYRHLYLLYRATTNFIRVSKSNCTAFYKSFQKMLQIWTEKIQRSELESVKQERAKICKIFLPIFT